MELFSRAISEGLSNKIDCIANQCEDEIACSERHNIAMRAILFGKAETSRRYELKIKYVIAILVAFALLITSCGVVFRSEIREMFEALFVSLSYEGDAEQHKIINEIYKLGYLPYGYHLVEERVSSLSVYYKFENSNEEFFVFEQHTLYGSNLIIDNESGHSKIDEINDYEIYYRYTSNSHIYVRNIGEYSIKIKSSIAFSNEEIVLILKGIEIK